MLDVPLMSERVDDGSPAPAVLLNDGGSFRRAALDSLLDHRVRLVAPSIASGLSRFKAGLAAATQNGRLLSSG